ncbi:MAG: TetR/AcrR family transcriptional regulator [Candidatus Omnitrophica bacterium]|nr:TetR/AcrR family transcriptional regulator [Candidatus Omnitrophota bacterium]
MNKNTIKQKVLDAAKARMIRFGYRKTSMDEIASDLKMSKNTIYKFFQSKAEIAQNLFVRLKESINLEQTAIEQKEKDPLRIIAANTLFLQESLSPWFDHFLLDIKSELPTLWSDFVTFRTEKIMDVEKLIKKGIKKKEFRSVNTAIAVRAYLGAINSIINPEFLSSDKISFKEALESVLDIWSKGILAVKK